MLALFDYARWVYASAGGKSADVDLHNIAPEVFAELERRLDVDIEPTAAVRSTIGENFVSTFAMARAWASANAMRVFSYDGPGDAAWVAYLGHNQAYDEIYDVLANRYRASVENISADVEKPTRWDGTSSLGVHLVTMYVRERLLLQGSILEAYFQKASAAAVGQTLTAVGNATLGKEQLSQAMLARCQEFYELVLNLYRERPIESRFEALGSFGIWFDSRQLPEAWLLQRLIDTLEQTGGRIAWENRVFERLHELAPAHPHAAVQCLYALTLGSYRWVFMSEDDVAGILSYAISAGGETKQLAVKTNDRLVNMGVLRYNHLFES